SASGTIWRNSDFLMVRCRGRLRVAMAHLLGYERIEPDRRRSRNPQPCGVEAEGLRSPDDRRMRSVGPCEEWPVPWCAADPAGAGSSCLDVVDHGQHLA